MQAAIDAALKREDIYDLVEVDVTFKGEPFALPDHGYDKAR
jgi:hypothetical protein